MAEVLSQSQIDALLNAVRTGEKDLEETHEEQPEKKYRKYDFNSPRKFTKDRIKMLSSIFENYTRVINNRLNGLLRVNCEMEVESIEEQHYYEFSNALTESDVLAIAAVDFNGKSEAEDAPVMLHISIATALAMMDRMMGGEGEMEEEVPDDYTYTDLELKLFENLAEDMISFMGGSWENYIPIHFTYDRVEVNPTMVQLLGLDETVVIVGMGVKMGSVTGRMSICLPGTILTSVFAEMNREKSTRRVTEEDNSDDIFNKLRDSDLEVIALLGDTRLSLSDLYHLNVGDVVDLGRPKDSPIYLEIGGYQWFSGRIGTHKKNMAVKIDEVCYQADQRSE